MSDPTRARANHAALCLPPSSGPFLWLLIDPILAHVLIVFVVGVRLLPLRPRRVRRVHEVVQRAAACAGRRRLHGRAPRLRPVFFSSAICFGAVPPSPVLSLSGVAPAPRCAPALPGCAASCSGLGPLLPPSLYASSALALGVLSLLSWLLVRGVGVAIACTPFKRAVLTRLLCSCLLPRLAGSQRGALLDVRNVAAARAEAARR